jgi:hypothetical protein
MNQKIAFTTQPVTDAEFALGSDQVDRLLPADVPGEYAFDGNPWNRLSTQVLAEGIGTEHAFLQQDGIDTRAALRHIGALLQSTCDDARKVAGAAYLFATWFKYVRVGGTTAAAI